MNGRHTSHVKEERLCWSSMSSILMMLQQQRNWAGFSWLLPNEQQRSLSVLHSNSAMRVSGKVTGMEAMRRLVQTGFKQSNPLLWFLVFCFFPTLALTIQIYQKNTKIKYYKHTQHYTTFIVHVSGLNAVQPQKKKLNKRQNTHWTSVRGWLTHFLISLRPKWVQVWSSTHSRLPLTPPSVYQQKNMAGLTDLCRTPKMQVFRVSAHLIVEDLQVPEGGGAEHQTLRGAGQTLERAN